MFILSKDTENKHVNAVITQGLREKPASLRDLCRLLFISIIIPMHSQVSTYISSLADFKGSACESIGSYKPHR